MWLRRGDQGENLASIRTRTPIGAAEGRAKPDRRAVPISGAPVQGPLAVGSDRRKLLICLRYRRLAGRPRHRPPDEALHELSKDSFRRGRGGQGGIFHRERISDRGRPATAVGQDGAERPAAAGPPRTLLGRRGRADPESRARDPRDRIAPGSAPAPSRPKPQHPPHAGAARQWPGGRSTGPSRR